MEQTNAARYQAIARAARGARNEDVHAAMGGAMASRKATALNDVGWRIFAGNYERYMRMLDPQASSVGLWRVASADPTQPHGRFARSFQHSDDSLQRSRSARVFLRVRGGDHGMDHNQNWLRVTHVFICSRSDHLPPHP